MKHQNEQKKGPNATLALVITSALVEATFGGKIEIMVIWIMITANRGVDISELIFFNLTVDLWCNKNS